MTELSDRLDRLARQATEGVELLPPDLMLRARRRHRTRVGLGGAGAAALAAVGSVLGLVTTSSHHPTVVNVGTSPTTSSPVNHLAPLPDTALTPPGWSPVALGTVQVSVPSSWFVEDPGYSCGAVPGMVFIDRQPGFGGASQCSLAPNVVSIAPSSTAAVPHAASGELNSIEVTSGWDQAGSIRTEIVRALGYDISASGPLADQVVRTLTHSPLSVVLNSQVTSTPTGWQSVTFGGIRFSVPPTWNISRFSWWGGCPGNLRPNMLELSTAETISALGCSGPPQTAGYNAGVPSMVVGSGPEIRSIETGADCLKRNGLRICIDPPPNPSGGYEPGHGLNILTAQVSVPGQAHLDQIEIGLSGDGTQALKIFESLRPAS